MRLLWSAKWICTTISIYFDCIVLTSTWYMPLYLVTYVRILIEILLNYRIFPVVPFINTELLSPINQINTRMSYIDYSLEEETEQDVSGLHKEHLWRYLIPSGETSGHCLQSFFPTRGPDSHLLVPPPTTCHIPGKKKQWKMFWSCRSIVAAIRAGHTNHQVLHYLSYRHTNTHTHFTQTSHNHHILTHTSLSKYR
jgi:hypothetical protein